MINMASSSAPFSPSAVSLIFSPKPLHLLAAKNSFSPLHAFTFTSTESSRKRLHYLNLPDAIRRKPTKSWKFWANNGNFFLSAASPVESSEEIVSPSNDAGNTVISALFFLAFIGLSILTIGVIYIAVTDFLQKREREKFEKEEAAKKKKGKKGKVRTRARAGPRGFGQKIEEDDGVDEAD
ncbi:hypothetical protein CDL12_01960 [Handroanthus impetiginosus]|uniref:Transmembrane protein n=1 Tax=Handroanthus impetiginosus TaxID=429701 RepID=A0A2G9I6B9_9LAMI|nr:hypothetical protein CDL12_01960 [Handroanthus impetiginosus]